MSSETELDVHAATAQVSHAGGKENDSLVTSTAVLDAGSRGESDQLLTNKLSAKNQLLLDVLAIELPKPLQDSQFASLNRLLSRCRELLGNSKVAKNLKKAVAAATALSDGLEGENEENVMAQMKQLLPPTEATSAADEGTSSGCSHASPKEVTAEKKDVGLIQVHQQTALSANTGRDEVTSADQSQRKRRTIKRPRRFDDYYLEEDKVQVTNRARGAKRHCQKAHPDGPSNKPVTGSRKAGDEKDRLQDARHLLAMRRQLCQESRNESAI